MFFKYNQITVTDYHRGKKGDIHEKVMEGYPYQLSCHGRSVAWLVSWWQLAVILKVRQVVVHPETFSASQLSLRWLEVKELLDKCDVVRAHKNSQKNAFAVVAPRLFFDIWKDLPLPTPDADCMTATLSQLNNSPKQFFRPASRGSVVLITNHGCPIGYLLSATKLAKIRFQGKRCDPIASGRICQQVGLYLDLMEAGHGDVQPITIAGKEVLALVPMRVWRQLSLNPSGFVAVKASEVHG